MNEQKILYKTKIQDFMGKMDRYIRTGQVIEFYCE